eukprot:Nk52_evm10s358 gene=Nk52_evmTU10s358
MALRLSSVNRVGARSGFDAHALTLVRCSMRNFLGSSGAWKTNAAVIPSRMSLILQHTGEEEEDGEEEEEAESATSCEEEIEEEIEGEEEGGGGGGEGGGGEEGGGEGGEEYLNEKLLEAVHNNDPETLRAVLAQGARVVSVKKKKEEEEEEEENGNNDKKKKKKKKMEEEEEGEKREGLSVVGEAVVKGYGECLELLLRYGGDVEGEEGGEEGEGEGGGGKKSLLYLAVVNQQEEACRLLLENKADVNSCKGGGGEVPLVCAIKTGNERIARLLIAHGADVNHESLLMRPVTPIKRRKNDPHHHRSPSALSLSSSSGGTQQQGNSPLHHAVLQNKYNMVELLVQNDADVNSRNKKNKATPLMMAVQNKNFTISELLIQSGANLLAQDVGGNTVLHYAARQGGPRLLDLLITFSPTESFVNYVNTEGDTALHAVFKALEEETKRRKANRKLKDSEHGKGEVGEEEEDVSEKEFEGYIECLEILLENGADTEAITITEDMPIHCAVRSGVYRAIGKLLQYEVDVSVKDKQGFSPLQLALLNNHSKIANLLKQHGAILEKPAGYSPKKVKKVAKVRTVNAPAADQPKQTDLSQSASASLHKSKKSSSSASANPEPSIVIPVASSSPTSEKKSIRRRSPVKKKKRAPPKRVLTPVDLSGYNEQLPPFEDYQYYVHDRMLPGNTGRASSPPLPAGLLRPRREVSPRSPGRRILSDGHPTHTHSHLYMPFNKNNIHSGTNAGYGYVASYNGRERHSGRPPWRAPGAIKETFGPFLRPGEERRTVKHSPRPASTNGITHLGYERVQSLRAEKPESFKKMFPRYQYENESVLDALKRKFHEDAHVYRLKALQEETLRSRSCSPPKTRSYPRPQSAPFVKASDAPRASSKKLSPYATEPAGKSSRADKKSTAVRPTRPHSSAGLVGMPNKEWGSSQAKGSIRKPARAMKASSRPQSRQSAPETWKDYEELCDEKIEQSIDAIEQTKKYNSLAGDLKYRDPANTQKPPQPFGGKQDSLEGLSAWKESYNRELNDLKRSLHLTVPIDDAYAETWMHDENELRSASGKGAPKKKGVKKGTKKGTKKNGQLSHANVPQVPELDNRTKAHIEDLVRMEMENLLHPETMAATCIQAHFRGYLARKRYRNLLQTIFDVDIPDALEKSTQEEDPVVIKKLKSHPALQMAANHTYPGGRLGEVGEDLIVCSVGDNDEPGTPVLYQPMAKGDDIPLKSSKLEQCKVLVATPRSQKPPKAPSSTQVNAKKNAVTQTDSTLEEGANAQMQMFQNIANAEASPILAGDHPRRERQLQEMEEEAHARIQRMEEELLQKQKEMEDAEKAAKKRLEEQERVLKEQQEEQLKKQAEQQAKEEAAQREQEEAEQREKEEAEQREKEEAEQREKEEAEQRRKEEESQQQLTEEEKQRAELEEAERIAMEEAERKLREEEENRLREIEATRIQAGYRGYQARKQVKNLKKEMEILEEKAKQAEDEERQREVLARLLKDEEEAKEMRDRNAASRLIQNRYREHRKALALKIEKEKKEAEDAEKEQERLREEYKAEKERIKRRLAEAEEAKKQKADQEEEEKRKKQKKFKEEKKKALERLKALEDLEKQKDAARKISAAVKGHMTRKDFDEMKKARDAMEAQHRDEVQNAMPEDEGSGGSEADFEEENPISALAEYVEGVQAGAPTPAMFAPPKRGEGQEGVMLDTKDKELIQKFLSFVKESDRIKLENEAAEASDASSNARKRRRKIRDSLRQGGAKSIQKIRSALTTS